MPDLDWAAIVREYGLPLAILVAFGFLIITGRLRTEREVTEAQNETRLARHAAAEREQHLRREMETGINAWKLLYEQERADRIAAQGEVRDNIDALKVAFSVLDRIEQQHKP